MIKKTLIVLSLAGGLTTAASAGVVNVSNIGGGITLNSGPLTALVLGSGESTWTSLSVASVHAQINSSGIATDEKITFIAADTDKGLAFMALIDRELVQGTPLTGRVHMDSVANGNNLAYINDAAGNVTVTAPGANSRIATGDFAWNSNGGGDAFAWAGLVTGNSLTFRFNKLLGDNLRLEDPSTFQFLNWNGTAWEQISVPANLLSFSETNDFGFAANVVVPAPSVLAIGGASLMGLSVRRRRAR
jgi:hypothetical protein